MAGRARLRGVPAYGVEERQCPVGLVEVFMYLLAPVAGVAFLGFLLFHAAKEVFERARGFRRLFVASVLGSVGILFLLALPVPEVRSSEIVVACAPPSSWAGNCRASTTRGTRIRRRRA